MRQRLGREIGGIVPDMSGVERRVAALGPELEAMQPRLDRARSNYEWSQTPEGQAFLAQMEGYHTDQRNPANRGGGEMTPYRLFAGARRQYGGRVGFKTGGRISRKKKGAKFI